MSKPTKDEVMNQLRGRYARTGRKHKSKLLDQPIGLFDDHRKGAHFAATTVVPKVAEGLSNDGARGATRPTTPVVQVGLLCRSWGK